MEQGFFLPPGKGKTEKAVVFLHGYGANGFDFAPLCEAYAAEMPGTAFFSPHAAEPWEGGFPDAYQWFSLRSWDPGALFGGASSLRAAAADFIRLAEPPRRKIETFVEEIKEKFSLGAGDVSVLGFSQGGLMALLYALGRKEPVGGVISFSGVPLAAALPEAPPTRILLIQGQDDAVVPPLSLPVSQETLRAMGMEPEVLMVPGMGHEVDARAAAAGLAFLKNKPRV